MTMTVLNPFAGFSISLPFTATFARRQTRREKLYDKGYQDAQAVLNDLCEQMETLGRQGGVLATSESGMEPPCRLACTDTLYLKGYRDFCRDIFGIEGRRIGLRYTSPVLENKVFAHIYVRNP